MNLEALKATLKRAQTWVKKNPKKAAIAGVVLAVLIYFAIKQGSQSDGESISGEPTSDSSGLDSFGGGLSAGGSSGDSAGESSGGSSGGSAGGSSGGLSGGGLSIITGADFTSSGGSDSFGFDSSFLPEFPASGFVNSAPSFPSSSQSILSGGTLSGGTEKKSSDGLATKPTPPPQQVTISAPKVSSGLIKKPAPVVTPKPAPKPSNTIGSQVGGGSKTDAEKAGLPKYFTGVSGGKRYAFGRFTGNVSTPKPAPKPAPKPSKGIKRS